MIGVSTLARWWASCSATFSLDKVAMSEGGGLSWSSRSNIFRKSTGARVNALTSGDPPSRLGQVAKAFPDTSLSTSPMGRFPCDLEGNGAEGKPGLPNS
nr:hypothetical protein Itr_chr03CG01770 [Ipomoea trifida]GMD53685.1 hypothetical protein Iba_scaffold47494CG0010 [Ipomoea batatas]